MKKLIYIIILFKIIENRVRRKLEEDEIIKLCKKCESTFNSTYKDKLLLNNTSTNDKINPYVKLLVEILKTDFNSSQLIDDYVDPRIINPNIIFIILLIVLLIIWSILIYLVCKNKKYFKFNTDINSTTHFKYYFLFYSILSIFIIIIILSSVSIYYIFKNSIYFNSSICSLFRIYIDLRDGDQANTTYWKGIRNLEKYLIGDKSVISQLINNIELQENVTYDLKNNGPNKKYMEKTFYDNEEKNNFYFNYEVSSPNPSSILKVYPIYTRDRKSDLDNITLEYINKLYPGVEANEQITNLNKPIKDNPDLINSEYLLVNKYLNNILETAQISAEEYLQHLVDYSKKVNNIIFPILYTIFILSIIISLSGIISLFIYINKKNKKCFYILHFLWNFKLFLLLLTIISDIIFKIFEIFGEDGSGLLQYATSKENLDSSDSIIFRGAGKIFLEMCFNNENDGDLLTKILENVDYDSSILSKLKIIISKELFVKEYYNQMEKTQLNKTKELYENLEKMDNDISLISFYDLLILKNTQTVIDDLNLYTDYSNHLSYQDPLSNKHSYDIWTTIKDNCYLKYNNYEYINKDTNRTEGKKYCMVFDEFDKNIAKSFYSGIKCILTQDVDEHFSEYYDSLDDFKKENKIYLNENPNLINITKKYYNELILIKEKILEGLNYSVNVVNLIGVILHISSPDSSVSLDLFSFMNCKFLQRDSKVFYIMMEKLSKNSKKCLFFGIFLLVFLLIEALLIICNIYKYKKEEEESFNDRESSNNQNLLN